MKIQNSKIRSMTFLAFLSIVQLALAGFEDYEIGCFTVYVPKFEVYSEPITASFNGHLSITPENLGVLFRLQNDRSVKEIRRQGYLNLNDQGKLVLRTTPQHDFALFRSTPFLAYKDQNKFQLCADLSLGFDSNCTTPLVALLRYDGVLASEIYDELREFDEYGVFKEASSGNNRL